MKMKMNLILTLSSNTGFGMKIAKIIEGNMDGVTKIVPIREIKSDDSFLEEELKHLITRDMKIFLVMPEFNGSFPAYFKEWIDNQGWPSQLKDKKIFLVGYSGSFSGNVLGVNHMKAVLDYVGADTFRHTSHFTYNGKDLNIYKKETEIFVDLIEKFNNYE